MFNRIRVSALLAFSILAPQGSMAADYDEHFSDPSYIGQTIQFKGNVENFIADYQ